MATKRKSVAKKTEGGVPANMMADMTASAGGGFENVGREDIAIPFMRILQSLSPQVKKKNDEYIEGAEEGDVINTATLSVVKGEGGIYFVPCYYRREFHEFIPRDSGGGYVREHDESVLDIVERGEKGDKLENGNDIVTAATWYGLLVDKKTGNYQQAVVSMSGSQHKKSRRLMTSLKTLVMETPNGKFNPPMWYSLVHLKTVPESNVKGEYFNWEPALSGDVTQFGEAEGSEMYAAGKAFYEAVRKGDVKVNRNAMADAEPSASDEDGEDF